LSDELTDSASSAPEPLDTLVEIGNALAGVMSPTTAFEEVLGILGRRWGATRGAVSLLDPRSGEISIRSSHGLTASGRGARYGLGEGILGRVVESGRPVVVPRISQEPMFLNRAGQRSDTDKSDLTYICAPILVDNRPVGALAVDLGYDKGRNYDAVLACMRVAAAMMAQTIKADHLVDEERRRLIEENSGTMPSQSFSEAVEAFERDLLSDALRSTGGNRAKAARLLGTTPRILNYKVRKYQLKSKQAPFSPGA
jgi:Nif-specific regulatory protein